MAGSFTLLMTQLDLKKSTLGVLSDHVVFLHFRQIQRIPQLEIPRCLISPLLHKDLAVSSKSGCVDLQLEIGWLLLDLFDKVDLVKRYLFHSLAAYSQRVLRVLQVRRRTAIVLSAVVEVLLLLVLLFSFLILLYYTLLILLHRIVRFHVNHIVLLFLLLHFFCRLDNIGTFFCTIEFDGVHAKLLEPLPSFEGPLNFSGGIHLSFNPDRKQLVSFINFSL